VIFILYAINTIFLCLGLAVLGLGAWAVAEGVKYQITTTVAVGVIVLGAIVFVISFMGCFGAFKVSKCLLYTYAVVLLLLLIAFLVIGIVGYLNKSSLYTYASDAWSEASNDTRGLIEKNFNCCGFYNSTDRPYGNGTFVCAMYPNNLTACETAIIDKLESFFTPIAGVGFALVIITLLGIIFAIVVACKGEDQ